MPFDPAMLHIRTYPDPALRAPARPVAEVTDEVRAVALRMIELMYQARGIGLAAPQVGLPWRMFVADVPPPESPEDEDPLPEPGAITTTSGPIIYINPQLSAYTRDMVPYEEGCLSLPEIRGDVRRPSGVTIAALDQHGRPFTTRGAGLLARCWQHECDHLDGVLIIDKMSQLSKVRNRAAIRGLERGAAPL